jgi:hypothetical protein
LAFTSSRLGGAGANEAWMSTRTNAMAPWEPARYLPRPINNANDTFPVEISRDGLLLFLKSWRPLASPSGADNTHAIYVSRRTSQGESFGAPVLIQPILGLAHESDYCSLSDDGTTMYVCTYRTGFPSWPQVLQMSLTALPQLIAPTRAEHGELQFGLLGREGANYEIQVSPDLGNWNSWLGTNTTGSVVISDAAAAPEGHRSYRALSH